MWGKMPIYGAYPTCIATLSSFGARGGCWPAFKRTLFPTFKNKANDKD
jgi:hypothetical protein